MRRLSALEELRFSKATITDRAIANIGCLSKLEVLDLSSTQITDDGLAHLMALPEIANPCLVFLSDLYLNHTGITDKTLERLAKLNRLEHLSLDSTNVTDEGILHLHQLHLKSISLTDTAVTKDGLRKLAEKMPSCQIAFRTRRGGVWHNRWRKIVNYDEPEMAAGQ